MNTSVKLIMKWSIIEGKDQEYFEFVVREWIPATQQLGLQTVGAWFSMYARDASAPRIMAELMADSLDTMRDILKTKAWQDLRLRLDEYVENYSQKVVYTNGNFQL
jgi:hypothetical protein